MTNSAARSSVDVGAVIADTYIIEALIGQGGMGSVFLASHTRLPGKRVAIKLLHVELNSDELLARFRREATIATQLDHPNIVRVDDFNVHADGTPYLVLEYLEGQSLAQRLERGPLPLEQVMSITRMVGSAIAAAHQLGYIHRDLKPQNIFLIETEVDGKGVEVAKVLDFGISKMRGSSTVQTQENTLLGTPQYMAPEQARSDHAAVDERTDVFALGAIVYEMLTGRPAFSGANIPEVVFKVVYEQPPPLASVTHVPAAVVAAVERAMQKRPDDRYPTVNAFVEALTGRPIVQRSAMSSQSTDRPKSVPPTTANAFANTVDSGSVDKATVSPVAETVASQPGDEQSPMAPVQARPRGLLIGLALAGIAALGVGLVLALGDEDAVDEPIASVQPDATRVVGFDATLDAMLAISVDAAPAFDAAVLANVVDAGASKPVVRPAIVSRKGGDPVAWEWLEKAKVAFDAGNFEVAKQHCNSVIDQSQTASAPQRSLALLMRGTIHCKARNVGLAQADHRAIPLQRFKNQLIARCRAVGQPLQ